MLILAKLFDMNLVCVFKTDKIPVSEIQKKLSEKGVKLTNEIYSLSYRVHFYFEHRHALKVRDLFSSEDDFIIRVSRFNSER